MDVAPHYTSLELYNKIYFWFNFPMIRISGFTDLLLSIFAMTAHRGPFYLYSNMIFSSSSSAHYSRLICGSIWFTYLSLTCLEVRPGSPTNSLYSYFRLFWSIVSRTPWRHLEEQCLLQRSTFSSFFFLNPEVSYIFVNIERYFFPLNVLWLISNFLNIFCSISLSFLLHR